VCRKADQLFSELNGYSDSLLENGFTHLSDAEMLRTLQGMTHKSDKMFPQLHLMNAVAGLSFNMLQRTLERGFPGRGNRLANAILAGKGEITSAAHGYRLMELAEIVRRDPDAKLFFSSQDYAPLLWESRLPNGSSFKALFREFLKDYGHRGVYEGDFMNPRWREDPTYLLNSIRSMIGSADPGAMRKRQREASERAWQEIAAGATFPQRVFIRKLVQWAARSAALREMAKSVMVRFGGVHRMLALEAGRRFMERGIIEQREDIFHCTQSELLGLLAGDWDGKGIDLLVAERKTARKEMEALSPPDVVYGEIPRCADPVGPGAGEVLSGLGVAAGRAAGRARIIHHPNEGVHLKPGEVLVAPSTDPAWTPLFLRASALVMETGGFSSHGAIVAREYGLPAVANIPGVLQVIEDGQQVTVNGDEGKVHLGG
jgi:pyruvate,water dikinase